MSERERELKSYYVGMIPREGGVRFGTILEARDRREAEQTARALAHKAWKGVSEKNWMVSELCFSHEMTAEQSTNALRWQRWLSGGGIPPSSERLGG